MHKNIESLLIRIISMSGRPSRQLGISQRTQNINDDDAWEKRRIVLQNLHDAAQIGDVSTVKHIFETYTELHIDITRRGRNTTLHTAISIRDMPLKSPESNDVFAPA